MPINLKKYLSYFLFIVLILSISTSVFASLAGYSNVIVVTITNSTNTTYSDQQILVTIDTQSLINDGEMQSDGDDIRFLDSDDSTNLDYWIDPGTLNTTTTRIWVNVPSITKNASKDIYMYFGNPSATSASDMSATMEEFGEVGTIAVLGSGWITTNFVNAYNNPVVVPVHFDLSTGQEVSCSLRNVGANSFDIKLENPEGDAFTNRRVDYIVVEEGAWILADESKIEADVFGIKKTELVGTTVSDKWKTISLTQSYSAAPVILAQLQTTENNDWVTDHVRTVTTSQFQVAMEICAAGSNINKNEDMGWIGIETAKSGNMNNIEYDFNTTGDRITGHDNGCTATNFSTAFSSAPYAIADLRKRDGTDGGWAAVCNLTTALIGLHVEEDDVADAEHAHTTEDISFVAFGSTGTLPLAKFATGLSVSVDQTRKKLVFTNLPQTISAGSASSAITVQIQSHFGAPSVNNTGSPIVIDLGSDSETGEFSTNSGFGSIVTSVSIPNGSSTATFYYRDNTICSAVLTAAEETASKNWVDAIASITTTETFVAGLNNSEVTITSTETLTNYQVLVTVDTATLIALGSMKSDGSDIRFLDSNGTTLLDYWIESGINTSETRIWVEVPSVPNGDKKITLNYGNPDAKPKSSISSTMISAEAGAITVGGTWDTIIFKKSYTNPVFVATHEEQGSGAGEEEAAPRIRNLGSTSVDIFLIHPGGTSLPSRKINYIVVEKGTGATVTGTTVAGHRVDADVIDDLANTVGNYDGVSDSYNTVNLPQTPPPKKDYYSSAPVVLAMVQSYNDSRFVTDHIRNIATDDFQIALEVGEINYSADPHAAEDMGWIAMEDSMAGSIGDYFFESGITGNIAGHDNGCYSTIYDQDYSVTPFTNVDLRTRNGGDGGWAVICSNSKDQFGSHVEEDQERDSERSHTNETASYFAFENSGAFPLRKDVRDEVGDTGAIPPVSSIQFPAARLGLSIASSSVFVDRVSDEITLTLEDAFGNAVTASTDIIVNLLTTSNSGEFSFGSAPFSSISSVTIANGSSSVTFYYKDGKIGSPTITASEDPSLELVDATLSLSIDDVEVYGKYRLSIEIDNTGNPELTEFQVLIIMDTATLIAEGKMNADGSDIRLTDSDKITRLNHWIESGINTASTRIWVKVPVIPSNSKKTIYLYYGNPDLADASNMVATMVNSEVGKVENLSDTPSQTVNLQGIYTNPVIVAFSSCAGGNWFAASTRIVATGTTSFDIKLQNPGDSSLNGGVITNPREVHYWITENGLHETIDATGHIIEAKNTQISGSLGKHSGGNNDYDSISFDAEFSSFISANPVIFSQVLTTTDKRWCTDHIRTQNQNNFQLGMEVAEARYVHDPEYLSWIALENNLNITNYLTTIETGFTGNRIRGHQNGCYSTNFRQAFATVPIFISDITTRHGTDGGWCMRCSLSASAFGLHVEEDRVSDSERSHTNETADYVAFSREGFIPLRKYADVNIDMGTTGAEEKPIHEIVFKTLSQTIFAGQASSVITIQTLDADGFETPVSTDTEIRLITSSISGEFSLNVSPWIRVTNITIPAGESEISFYYKDDTPGTFSLRAYEYPSKGWDDASQNITILPLSAGFRLDVSDAQPIIAGTPFTLIISAVDDDNNIVQGYNGTVELTINYVSPPTGTDLLSVTTVSGFLNGVASINPYYPEAGTITLTATDTIDANKTGTSSNITFVPASITVETTFQQKVDAPFTLTVSALNSLGNVTKNYSGPVNLSINYITPSNDQGGTLTPVSLSSFTEGVGTITDLVYDKWGIITIKVTDPVDTRLVATTENITFAPQYFDVFVQTPPKERSFYYENETFELTLSVRSFLDNIIENYTGTIQITGTSIFGLESTYTFLPSDSGIHTFELAGTTDGEYKILFADLFDATVIGKSDTIIIKFGKIIIGSNEGPVGILPVDIFIVDKEENIITEDSSTQLKITLTESNPNNTASIDVEGESITFNEGKITIEVLDSEAETVDIKGESEPLMEVSPGKVLYGTIGDSGIRIRFWREKD